MDAANRIEQFTRMTQADPDNELGHFSLGKALLEAHRYEEAVAALSRATELNPALSKAYQFLGAAMTRSGQDERAVEVLTRGHEVAERQGDIMPLKAMARMLAKLGAPVPGPKSPPPARDPQPEPAPDSTILPGFTCTRCGGHQNPLPKPPFRGGTGERIGEHTCAGCWQEWLGNGTKVINELRLSLASEEDQRVYDQYMLEFLGLDEV